MSPKERYDALVKQMREGVRISSQDFCFVKAFEFHSRNRNRRWNQAMLRNNKVVLGYNTISK